MDQIFSFLGLKRCRHTEIVGFFTQNRLETTSNTVRPEVSPTMSKLPWSKHRKVDSGRKTLGIHPFQCSPLRTHFSAVWPWKFRPGWGALLVVRYCSLFLNDSPWKVRQVEHVYSAVATKTKKFDPFSFIYPQMGLIASIPVLHHPC